MKEKLRGSGRPTRCLSPSFPGLSFESDLFPSFTSVCPPAKSLQSCLAFWDPRDWSPPGFSVYGILQARILEWDLPTSGIESLFPASAGGFFTADHQGSQVGCGVVVSRLSAWCGLCLPSRLHFAHRVFCRIDMIQASHCSSVVCPRPWVCW